MASALGPMQPNHQLPQASAYSEPPCPLLSRGSMWPHLLLSHVTVRETPRPQAFSCLAPPLRQIEPLSGPLDGGTLLTIRGRNLGRRLSDVEHGVWIGSVACEPLADRYTVSEE